MRHAPRIVSRDELGRALWGDDERPASDALRTHLYQLRRLIERAGSPPLIHTCGKQGYRPRYALLPAHIQRLLVPGARGLFELGPSIQDYFVLARSRADGQTFYVVEFHSEVKPTDTLEHQVFLRYLAIITPFGLVLLWLCKRVSARVTAPMRDVGQQVFARAPASLEPLTLPAGSSVELEALVAQINTSIGRTAAVLARERSFTQFASHELRTPAAVMQLALERIASQARPEQARAIERAQRALRDMHALVDTFLQLSTDGSDAQPSGTTVVDAAWLQSLMQHITAGQVEDRLIVDAEAPLALEAPATLVHVLVGNLLKNALFHGGPGPIHVSVRADGLVVRNGLRDEPGTLGFGLGSRIVRSICDRFGWRFDLSLADGAAVAQIRLPSPPRP